MSDTGVRWLHGELDGLVASGVVDAPTAERLRRHYPLPPPAPAGAWARLVFGLLGAVLIAAGIVLVVAHNWDDLSPLARSGLALALLALGQAGVLFAQARHPNSVGWREGTTTFTAIALGASLALVSQAYQVQGDFSGFLLTWMLLALPVAVLSGAILPLGMYLVCVAIWVGNLRGADAIGTLDVPRHLLAFVWFGLAAPSVVARLRRHPTGIPSGLLALAAVGSLGLSVQLMMIGWNARWVLQMVSWASMAGGFAALGLSFRKPQPWAAPLAPIATFVLLVVLVIGSFTDTWQPSSWRTVDGAREVVSWTLAIVTAGLAMGIAALATRRVGIAAAITAWAPAAFLLALVASAMLGRDTGSVAAVIVINAYAIAAGIVLLLDGLHTGRFAAANGGVFMLGAVLMARFLDADLDFLVRGLGFIAVGVGFLAVNLTVLRRRAETP